ncbi:MAG: hypothetical protein EBU92_06335 [Betaproteobacteria bacterium]|nr:hypothetical protein [Betaproteobacteria bacterium]
MYSIYQATQNFFKRSQSSAFVIFFLCLNSTVVFAEWERVGEERASSLEYYLDMQSVKQTGPMSIYRQVKVLIQGPAIKSQSLESAISLNEYDCMNAKLRVLQTTGFTQPWGNGDKVALSTPSSQTNEWQAQLLLITY